MKNFAQLIKTIDSTNKTNLKVAALTEYFQTAADNDKLWAIAILSHRRPKRPVNTTLLRQWATEISDIPLWLFEESYHIVGDLAETIALILPKTESSSNKSLAAYISEIQTLRTLPEAEKKEYLHTNWMKLDYYERFVFNKIITGSFRIGVSQKLMTRALSKATNIDEDILAYKLMGNWTPDSTTFQKLVLEENEEDYLSKPYPFYLAYAVEDDFQKELEPISQWSFEHKWDGIRAQVIIRNNEVFTWSRGEELVTDKFPEFQKFLKEIPNGTVLDGEILPFGNDVIGNFKDLQTRIGRKNITKALLKKTPVILIAYDLLEWKGEDIRQRSFSERRKILDKLINDCNCNSLGLYLSETMAFSRSC